jgi:RNA polymerase sigma-70 factor (ECF subfamily)
MFGEYTNVGITLTKHLDHTDEQLLTMIAQDSEKAFELLFERYWEMAHRIAYSKLKSKEITQEIVLEIFLNFWERRHTIQINNFQSYLRVSVKYKVITYLNREILQRKHFEEYLDQAQFETEDTLQSVEFNDLSKALDEGIRVLPERTQEVFRLSRLEGRSVSEIARQLNLSDKAIEYHITRSRKELRLYLKDFLIAVCIIPYFLLP